MNERVARDVLLVWAIENFDHERRILSDDDRMYASRSANELAQWEAADKKLPVSPDLYLQKRSEQILHRIAERVPAFPKLAARRAWWRGMGIALPMLALALGILADRIADPHRVDLLSAPLLLLILWNLLVYAGLLLSLILPSPRMRWLDGSRLARLATWRSKPGKPRNAPQGITTALARFHSEWIRLSAPLTTARVKRIAHLGAACLALGAIISLYLRGIVLEYRAGWESTFLSAEQVQATLNVLFAPAMWLFRLDGFSIADVRALRFGQSGTSAGGGALWVHLYAATLFLLVVLPRVALAIAAGWKESRLARRFPIDLGQPYFRKLTARIGPAAAAVLRVFPYSFTIDETRDRHLSAVAQMLLGDQARVMLRPSTAYGEAPPDALGNAMPDSGDIALTAVLFNLSATPEKENHGAFLDYLARETKGRILSMIDESAYLERVGGQSGGAARVGERVALWRHFCESHKVPPIIVNLTDSRARAEDLERALASIVHPQ